MELNYGIIGMRLKQARINKKITQEALAEALDLSVAYISRIERGSTKINLKRLSEMCNYLDISQGEVLEGTTPTSNSYLTAALNDLLKNCPAEKMDLIYNIVKVIVEQ